jgi:hypothetical protein
LVGCLSQNVKGTPLALQCAITAELQEGGGCCGERARTRNVVGLVSVVGLVVGSRSHPSSSSGIAVYAEGCVDVVRLQREGSAAGVWLQKKQQQCTADGGDCSAGIGRICTGRGARACGGGARQRHVRRVIAALLCQSWESVGTRISHSEWSEVEVTVREL